jgi:hypothetical protein
LLARDTNATYRPSALISAAMLSPFPCAPSLATLTRSVTASVRSKTNTSRRPLVSPEIRFVAAESKALFEDRLGDLPSEYQDRTKRLQEALNRRKAAHAASVA